MATTQQDSKYDIVTLAKGYWWAFECDGDEITVHGSAMTGKERFYINDQLVFETLSLRLHGRHTFSHAGDVYALHFSTISLLTAEIECLVLKNGTLVGVKTVGYYSGKKSQVFQKKAWPIVTGLAFGAAGVLVGKSYAVAWHSFSGLTFIAVLASITLLMGGGSYLYWRRLKRQEQQAAEAETATPSAVGSRTNDQ